MSGCEGCPFSKNCDSQVCELESKDNKIVVGSEAEVEAEVEVKAEIDSPPLIIAKPLNAVLNLTNQCNLRCPYCFVHFNEQKVSLETAKATCEYLLNNATVEEKPNLWFFGGEPMLEYKRIIQPIVEEYGERIEFGITTNGTLLTEDVVDYFFKNNIPILLSIDGNEIVQSKQRPYANGKSSFEDVLKNIPYLLMFFPNTTFRSTLTKFSIPHMYDTYCFARHMGFTNIALCINEYEEYDEEDFQIMKTQYNKIVLEIVKGSPLWLSDLDKARDYEKTSLQNIHRCGYGTTSVGVDVNGNLMPCQELNSTTDFIIGNVFTGIDTEVHNKFLNLAVEKTILPDDLCSEERKFLENSLCPKHQYLENGFAISTGRKYQMLALREVYHRFHKLTALSTNEYYRRISI